MNRFYGILAVALVVGLAACSEESSEQKSSAPAAKTDDSATQAAPAPAAPPAAQAPASAAAPAPAPADDGAGAMDGAPQASAGKDEQACLKAVKSETHNTVATLSVEESEAATMVMVGVGPNKAPWKCLAKDGIVDEIMSMTDEGAL